MRSAGDGTDRSEPYGVLTDLATGRLLSTFRGPTPMFAVAYSPDGRTLAAADKEGAIYILDAGTAAGTAASVAP